MTDDTEVRSEARKKSTAARIHDSFTPGSFPTRHYPRAPITEALININFEMDPSFEVAKLRGFSGIVADGFSFAGEERLVNITASPSGVAPGLNVATGYRFVSRDQKYVVVTRNTSLGMSRLAPYETWDTFRDEARRIWNRFREEFGPVKISGASVRYVNRIEIPFKTGDVLDFQWYLRTAPEVSSDLNLGMAGFLMRLDIPIAPIGARLVLNEGLLPSSSPEPETVSVLLDIDILSPFEENVTDDEMWNRYETLRLAKNDVFEACITNATRELFR